MKMISSRRRWVQLCSFGFLLCLSKSLYAANLGQDYNALLSKVSGPNNSTLDYETFIQKAKVTGLSFAVVDDYQVVFSQVAGLKENGTQHKIDKKTAFSTASISKPVTATLVMMLAQQGKLDLDAPVNTYLKRWKIAPSELNGKQPITFRNLLSHTAGMTQGGFADFHLGDDIPTLIESLNGIKLPRYNSPISVDFEPETNWNYSGGGYVIVQVAIEDLTGKSLAQLAEEMLFAPLNMKHTTMYQNGHERFLSNLAKVHDINQKVIRDGIPICPQIAPSGMWSTPLDMAKFTIEYQKALAGKPTKVISNWVAKQTTDIQTIKVTGGWGAGWMRFEAQGNLDWFSHGGSNTGTGGHVMATMQGGKGIMIFINATTQTRNPAINILIENVVKNLHWTQPITSSEQPVPKALAEKMTGRYVSPVDQIVTISQQHDKLIYHNPLQIGGGQFTGEMYYMENNRFALDAHPNVIGLEINPADQQAYLTLFRPGTRLQDYAMRKLHDDEQLPFEVAENKDVEQSITAYMAWKKQHPNSRMVASNTLNNAGYTALAKKEFKAAINYFSVYVALYPNDANAYDSLAEGYMTKGNTQLAIENYRKSLTINGDNQNAKDMLKKLSATKAL
ncbi:MAG: serine hydrolase [Paraglaciecola sp.]|uniref:serine hydrolase n=1 Tax=Paraglaciecola sp. TaxID=1920173 RepID=UPI003299AA26